MAKKIKCPTCGKETEGVVNNRNERRCTYCYAVLPADVQPSSEPPVGATSTAGNEVQPSGGKSSGDTKATKKASK